MPRYIETESFENFVRERYCKPCQQDGRDYHGVKCRACEIDDMLCEVADAPTADVKEVKHGNWIKPSFMSERVCSNCQKPPRMLFGLLPDYCPICGAKMNVDYSNDEIDDTHG